MGFNPFLIVRRELRSHGFGVHSPFAFRFIREVLFQPYSYYAFYELEENNAIGKQKKETLKRLYRLILYFSPAELTIAGEDEDISRMVEVARYENKTKENISMLISGNDSGDAGKDMDVIVRLLNKRENRVIEEMKRNCDIRGYGMIFYGKNMAVQVNDRRLPRCDYNVRI